jgi:hypothetical protein
LFEPSKTIRRESGHIGQALHVAKLGSELQQSVGSFQIIETSSQFKTFSASAEILRPRNSCCQVAVIEEKSVSGVNGFDSAARLMHLAKVTNLAHDRH